MIRAISLAALAAAALAVPVFAETADTTKSDAIDPAKSAAFSAALANDAAAYQARVQLAHQGYVNISELDRNDDGNWTGTAVKDGKTVLVTVQSHRAPAEAATN